MADVAVRETGTARSRRPRRSRQVRTLSGVDRLTVALMVGIPTLVVATLVWGPAIATVLLSFTDWNGIGNIGDINFIGLENFRNATTNYPPFAPAIQHNLTWLVVFFLGPTLLGMLLAVMLDRELRGSRIYQSIFFMPVVLSLALVGFIWQLIYSRDQGLLNSVLGTQTDWFGDPDINLWAVLVAAGWRHTGYIMLLYLAGLKAVDPALREAAAVDGAGEVRTFLQVVWPVMRPVNIVIIVITVIESLRAFDIAWVINKGRNGLELISTLVTQNVIGEASRVGFGSALATIMIVISTVFIIIYLIQVMREQRR
ncbi:carbohydrate ABC transporter permease [Actinophytocola sp.]|uniref:carbohydrate ABC transporter permease n=1 Tax=Actinophytocola sp. TaxID=1872138 RepID=UPI0025BFFC64|nr:sugar ABC transporter permease [Actinophytocola sp.]